MGRPKRQYSGLTEIVLGDQPFALNEAGQPLGVRRRHRWEAHRNAVYPIKNGNQCPLTVFHILDAVLAIDPQVELRAKELSRWLNYHRPTFVWDAVTVGKHLADLKDSFEERLGARHGLLIGGRDYKGNFYHVNRNPETAELAWRLMDDLLRLGQAEVNLRRAGGKTDFMGSPLWECPSLRGEWSDLSEEG